MAGPFDLTGQNIENTYQRILQTPDGVNIYDGTGSAFTVTATINTSSLVTTSSFNAFTASINIFTSSYNTGSFSGSFNGTASTASYYQEIDPIFVAKSASLATTGSNNFNGNQTITGSLTISGSQITTGSLRVIDPINGFNIISDQGWLLSGGQLSVNWGSRTLNDSGGNTSVDWINKTLTGARVTVDWGNTLLQDNSTANPSIDWEQRYLYASDGTTPHLGWNSISHMEFPSTIESPITRILGMDDSNRVYWTASSNIGGGSSTTPGGFNTQIQYNNSNTFGGVSTLTYDGITLRATGSFTGSFVGNLTGTASWANSVTSASYTATASRLNADNTSIFGSGNRMTITASNGIIMNAGSPGVDLQSKITVTGDVIPGPPYTNNTSSWSLGSSTTAWDKIYVSNNSLHFVSSSTSASIGFNNGIIDFNNATVNIPAGSTVPTASYAATSSVLNTATTVGQNLITLANPSSISYPQINANNTVSALSSTQLSNNLGFYTVNLNNDVSITAANTTLADVTGLSFPIIAGNKYKFTAYLLVTTSAANTGLRFGLNANVAVSTVNYTTRHNNGTQTAQFLWFANALDSVSSNAGSVTSNHLAIMEGFLVANNTGTAIVRFSKASANAGTLTVKATSFIEYQTL